MRTFSLSVCRLLITLIIVTSAFTASAEGPRELATVEGITEYRLENGLSVLLFPDSSRPTVTVNVTYLVGSRHEGYGEAGMAHLLEHLLFKGTPTHADVPKLLQERGARFNGSTSDDRTNYYETLTASEENLQFALRLEADRMTNSFVRQEDLDSEMTVVRNEFERGENSPTGVLFERVFSAAYDWHNYGHSTIGNRSDIERVPIKRLQAFYRRYYQPDNAVLVIAGRFDKAKALALVQKYFGAIPLPERELDKTYTVEPPKDGERTVILRRVGDVGTVIVAYHIPAGAHPDFAALRVLSNVMAMESSGRLYKALVETKKAASAYAFASPSRDPGAFAALAQVRSEGSLDEVKDILLDELEGLAGKDVTEEEVERAKQKILKLWELAMTDTSQIAVSLSEWAAQGDWRLYFLYRDRIEKVTPQSVNRVASQYLVRNNRTVGMFIPTEKPEQVAVPETPDLEALVRDYKGRETIAEGEEFDVALDNIEAHTVRQQLPSGVKLAVLPKKTRGEAVQLRVTLRYGDAENLKGLETAASVLPSLMIRGTEKLTHQEFRDLLDKHRATLSSSGDPGSVTFHVQTKRPELVPVLGLLRQVLREASLPADELEIIRQQQLAAIEQRKTEPSFLAVDSVTRTLSPYPKGHVLYSPTVEERLERIQKVSTEQLQKLYKQYLAGEVGEVVLVGDFDPDEIRPVLADMLEGWKSDLSHARIERRIKPDLAGSATTISTPGKTNAMYVAGGSIPVGDANPDYPALLIGNYILGGGMASRLGQRVRQQEGLSYSVGSQFMANSLDPVARFLIFAICNPLNAKKLGTIVREELDQLLADGVGEDELAEAKQAVLQRREVSRTGDSNLASMLADGLYTDRTMAYEAELERSIESLTPEQVLAVLRKYVDPDKLTIVTAGDLPDKEAVQQ